MADASSAALGGPLSAFVPSGLTGTIIRYERFRVPGRFGDLVASELAAILWKFDQGYLDNYADLVEYMIVSDDAMSSLYTTRTSRVIQANVKVVPNRFGDKQQAAKAAAFCDEILGRLSNWTDLVKQLLHATFAPLAASEMEWAYDGETNTYYVNKCHFAHPHRFRYDEQWKPRLYDQGRVLQYHHQAWEHSVYGRALDPRRWIVHHHKEVMAYPNCAGLARPALWVWMFRRWCDKFWIQSLERFGQPFIYAQVAPNTTESVRNKIIEDIEKLANDHTAVIEAGDLKMLQAAISSSASSAHEEYMKSSDNRLAKLVMGAAAITEAGSGGKSGGGNAAALTSVGATADPRMVVDGLEIAEAIEHSIFRWALRFNLHKFGGVMPPIPHLVFKNAADEVKTDIQGLADQNNGAVPSAGGGSSKSPIGGDLAQSMSDNAAVAAQGDDVKVPDAGDHSNVPQASAQPAETVTIGQDLTDDDMSSITGAGAATDPKAQSPSTGVHSPRAKKSQTSTSTRMNTTLPISMHSAGILAKTLRGASVDRRR